MIDTGWVDSDLYLSGWRNIADKRGVDNWKAVILRKRNLQLREFRRIHVLGRGLGFR